MRQYCEAVSLSTGASVPPTNVSVFALNSTAIRVEWNGLKPCTGVNGLIVTYRVNYTDESTGSEQSVEEAGKWDVVKAKAVIFGLAPRTNYSIQVAAVNEQGDVGEYSDPLIIQTFESSKYALE